MASTTFRLGLITIKKGRFRPLIRFYRHDFAGYSSAGTANRFADCIYGDLGKQRADDQFPVFRFKMCPIVFDVSRNRYYI